MRFHYIASEPNGRVVEADVEAQGPAEVLEWMAAQGLRPVSLKALGGVEAKGWRSIIGGQSITVEDTIHKVAGPAIGGVQRTFQVKNPW